MDATIIETAYHDDAGDVMYMKDALGRRWIARAVYQGIVRFYNNVHGQSFTMLPDEPRNLRALNATDSSNNIILTWQAPTANVSVEVATPATSAARRPTTPSIQALTGKTTPSAASSAAPPPPIPSPVFPSARPFSPWSPPSTRAARASPATSPAHASREPAPPSHRRRL